jgi:hypothetical protein
MNNSSNKNQERWALAGKILAIPAAIATIGGFGFYLYDRYGSRPDLTAYISAYDYEEPPNLDSKELADPLREISKYKGYYVIRIENDGGTQAEDVTLATEHRGIARIDSDTTDARVMAPISALEIGAIAPEQSATVQIWSLYPATTLFNDDFKIRHKTGVAQIIAMRETDGWWRTLWRTMYQIGAILLVSFALMFTVGGTIHLIANAATRRSGKRPSEPPSTGAS